MLKNARLLVLWVGVAGLWTAQAKPTDMAAELAQIDAFNARGEWRASWSSLSKHEIPEWFQDAKFGIYAHLGVYCVPAFGTEWYPRLMYQKNDRVYKHHVATYGDPSEFGYKDFIPMFTLDKFDPAEWAELYRQAGAKFAGPVAEHHDGFSMWASDINRWNVGNMGPKRDVAGELVRELRKRGLKIVTSFHHAFNIQGYYTPGKGWDTADPQYGDLYGFPLDKDRTLARNRWMLKLKEVIDRYKPDQIWFDFGLGRIPDDYKEKIAAYYYNHEKTWGKSVIITRKGDDLPKGVGALDIERGRMKDMGEALWQTDDATAYNSWSWVQGLRVKPAEEMVHELIDIVSKNGVLLLNVCPKADGTITEDQQAMLREMGQWLKVNGEAIYATRPWQMFGEGPTRMARGGGFLDTIVYTAEDIRYTRSKDNKTLYAIAMGWPDQAVTLKTVKARAGTGAKVELLGYSKPLSFDVSSDGQLTIHVPTLTEDQRPGRHAYAFKLAGFSLGLSEEARFMLPDAVTLSADKAVLEGQQIKTEEKYGKTTIGFWDRSSDKVHWLLPVSSAGVYDLVGEFATSNQGSNLTLEVADQSLTFEVRNTGNWAAFQVNPIGQVRFDQPGVYHVILKNTPGKPWHAVNVCRVRVAPVTQAVTK